MSHDHFDAVIAGAGLSGLSLAAHLATGGWADRSVLLLDDTPTTSAPGWAFWSARPGLLDAAVSRTFDEVVIHGSETSTVLPLGPYRYQVVSRPDLYRTAMNLIADCPRFAVRPGRVISVRDGIDTATVLADGHAITGSWVFDSVGLPPGNAAVDARLAFTGWEVHSQRVTFDPHRPILFDFRTPRVHDATRFVYVLPDGPHHALVELTEFVPRHTLPPTSVDREAALARYLHDVVRCTDYTVVRTESAVLPLRAFPPPRAGSRVLRIGARAGLIKASTGYAYQRIQRDSAAIARSLVRHGHPFDVASARPRHRLLDAVLLDVLDRDPVQLERAFIRLFSANPAERVLQFLDEDTNVRDELRLIVSLRPAPYLRAVATRLFSRQT
jgi:lycopene beta-cyclase